jgi:hypothetical protein
MGGYVRAIAACLLSISAEDNLLPRLTSDVSGDTLILHEAQHHDCPEQADQLHVDRERSHRHSSGWIRPRSGVEPDDEFSLRRSAARAT